jgi:hypothetical protein
MSDQTVRRILVPLVGAALCLAAMRHISATAQSPILEQFVARAVSVSDTADAGPVEILITRWSSDEDLQNLRAALTENGPGMALPVFRKARPEAGVLLMPGIKGLGERVRLRWALPFQFARQIDTPSGRQVVVATDHHFGFGEEPWNHVTYRATDQPPGSGDSTGGAPEPEFTLLDIRFGPDGQGVGKMAPAAKVAYSPTKNIVEIESYTTQPVRLNAVKLATH